MQPTDDRNSWFEGKGLWSDIPDSEWNDWRWQLRNRITKQSDLDGILTLSPEEIAGFSAAQNRLSVGVTPYFANLIDPKDFLCPIRRQVIPSIEESIVSGKERKDPVGEELDMVVPGVVHRYPDRVLFLVTDRCASYCRYCTRSRMVSNAQDYGFHPSLEAGLEYIKSNTSIRDVLLSGGDPLLLSDDKLSFLLSSLAEISHVEFVRIGSRIPVFLPQRITKGLIDSLQSHHNIWMSIHVNHPNECTKELYDACHKMAKAGIPLGNQSVLLKEVNDDPETMKSLIHRLLMMKVRPYYLYQCDLIEGSSHLRTDPLAGVRIIESLRGHTTGYAIPQFVIDAPDGGGKIPLNPNYLERVEGDKLHLRNFEGKSFVYDTGLGAKPKKKKLNTMGVS
ncbi:MAG: KamA family radical SAM protein [Opitutae bacterium]|nr:KamA family radical SAM protein [Opitutae bacterium]